MEPLVEEETEAERVEEEEEEEVLLELAPLDLVDVECGVVLEEDLETFVLVKTEAAGVM